MTADATYRCDWCRDVIQRADNIVSYRGVAVLYKSSPWMLSEEMTHSDKHLCDRCCTNLQAMEPQRCRAGMECSGGPFCTSSHK